MSPPAGTAPAERGGVGDLFGRGMLFVLVWSLQLVVATVVSPILAHTLPTAEFGSLSAAIALFQLLMVIAVFGLDQALEIQRVEDADPLRSRGLLATGIAFGLAFVALGWLTAGWWAPWLGFRPGSALVPITLLWTAPGAAVLMTLSLLQAEDRLRAFAIVSVFSTAGGLVFGLVLVFTVQRTAATYAWGGVIGQGIACLLGLLWTRPRWVGVWQPAVIRRALALGGPLVVAGLCEFILSAADRFLVQRTLGEVAVARYQVAFTVGNVLSLLLLFTNRAWIPRLKAIPDPARRWQAISGARNGILRLLGWAILGITVSAPVLLRIVAPLSYGPDELLVVVFAVALGALPLAAATAGIQMLVTERHSHPLAVASLIAVLVKAGLSAAALLLRGTVPVMTGIALATSLAILAQAGFLAIAVRRRFGRQDRSAGLGGTVAVVLGALLLSGISLLLPSTPTWLVGRFVFSAVCLVPFVLAWRALVGRPVRIGPGRGRRAAR